MAFLNGLVLGDLHIGSQDANVLYKQVETQFFDYLKNMKKCDFIIIAGDFFDHKISMNEESSKVAIKIMERIISLSKIHKVKAIRVIRGTRNHDLDQLDNFKIQEKKTKGLFRIINTVEAEEIIPGCKVLYLPEEYMEDYKEYYKEELFDVEDGTYDLCFGHGTFNFVAFTSQKQDSERPIKNAPIFQYEDIKDKVKGGVFFGHIHNKQVYKKKIYYTGSFSRWCFGEESPKGFIHMKYNPETEETKVKFVENELAPIYHTLSLNDEWHSIKDLSIDDKIKYIEETREKFLSENVDAHVRINIDKTKLMNETDSDLIKEYFSDKGNFKLNIQNDTLDILQESEEAKVEEKYEFILKNQLSFPEKVQQFIKEHENVDMDLEAIKEALFEE